MNLQPLEDRIVVRPGEQEETTASGIVIPDTGERIPVELKEGDRILFQKYAGTEFKLDDEELLILSEKDVLALVES